MKTSPLTLVLVALLAGSAAASSAQTPGGQPIGTGVISGRVVAAGTGEPIRGAVMRLLLYEVMRTPKTAVTDAQGRYEYTELPAGRYQLSVSAAGYLGLQFGQRLPTEAGKPIDLREGERFTTADLALPRMSAIEGTVLDEFGDPVPNAWLQILRVEFAINEHRLMSAPSGSRAVTDDKGHFRMFGVSPGEYYLSASTGAFVDPNASGGFDVTYYPGTADASQARPVRVPIGQELVGLSFALVPSGASRISGILLDESGQPTRGDVILALSDLGSVTGFSTARAPANLDGSFTFRNVPPGRYVLQGFGPPQGGGNLGRSPFGTTTVNLSGVDQDGLTLKVAAGARARGRIVFERTRGAADLKPNDVRVGFGPIDFDSNPIGGGPPESVTNTDWIFSVANQFGLRAMVVDLRSTAWMVKRATLDGRDVTDAPFDFRKGDVNDLEILMSDAVSSIGGTVVDQSGRPTNAYTVVIFADDAAKWRFPSRFVQLQRPNQEGRFMAFGLPPESYLAIAVPNVQGREWLDPVNLERWRDEAVAVSVREGEAKTVELKLVAPR